MNKSNALKAALLRGEPSLGCWLTLASPAVAEALAHCGFGWLLVDEEHGPSGTMDIAAQLRAIDAAGTGMAGVVRVAKNDGVRAKRAMDCGAQTLVFPCIESVDEARAAIAAMHFADAGNGGTRGLASLVRAGHYGLMPDYARSANREACAVLQIESVDGLQHCEAIAALDGADCLFVGPADLSASMGLLGQPQHPDVEAAVARVLAACRGAGKAAGFFAASAEDARARLAQGFTMVALHSDVAWLTRGASAALKATHV